MKDFLPHVLKRPLKTSMNRLWVRLSLAFIIITELSVFVVVALADNSVNGEFRRYVIVSKVSATSEVLAQYYKQTGGWVGVAKILTGPSIGQGPFVLPAPIDSATSSALGSGSVRVMPTPMKALTLTDATGKIVFDTQPGRVGSILNIQEYSDAIPIGVTASSDKPFGYILPAVPISVPLSVVPPPFPDDSGFRTSEQDFLDRIHKNLLLGALVIGVLGLSMGLVISRTLVAPLTNLLDATRAFAAHDWSFRAKLHGASEIVEVAASLNDMADELQRAETLRRNMIADIAHELRTPLAVMQANLIALLDGVFALEKGEIATLYEETCMLSRLVDDLRELAHADAGHLALRLETLDMAAILSSSIAKFTAAAETEGTQLTMQQVEEGEPLFVRADSDRVTQVLGNLLANALRHTPGGSIMIAAHPFPAGGTAQRAMVRIVITDTGEGMSAQDAPHIFDRFYRADKSRSRTSGNSGLGLAIAKAWVEAMGGQIGVESQLAEGSRFWFTLPSAHSPGNENFSRSRFVV